MCSSRSCHLPLEKGEAAVARWLEQRRKGKTMAFRYKVTAPDGDWVRVMTKSEESDAKLVNDFRQSRMSDGREPFPSVPPGWTVEKFAEADDETAED
jgi:hypothetical protein